MPVRPHLEAKVIDARPSPQPGRTPAATPHPLKLSARAAARMLVLGALLLGALVLPSAASASHSQISIIEDRSPLSTDPVPLMPQFRALGASTVRIFVEWHAIAPDPFGKKPPAGLDLSSPDSYPDSGWAPYDRAVEAAVRDGLSVELTVSGSAPAWAENLRNPGRGFDPAFAWKPIPSYYQQFVKAIGTRYSGTFIPADTSAEGTTPSGATTPLPAVHFWSIWNEPNFGEDLAPQAVNGSKLSVAPMLYRGLVNAGWVGLHQSGHGHDRILIGELAARGLTGPVTRAHPQGLPGFYAQTKPLLFIRTLYCLDAKAHRLKGAAARAVGCSGSAGSFRARNPGLFAASGFSDHPYAGADSPLGRPHMDPNFATFAQLGALGAALDQALRADGSHKRYAIYSDEFGYITHPPQSAAYPTPGAAATDLNWAEYLSWRNPRVASYMQYLLQDQKSGADNVSFATGLETAKGQPKATFYAYRLPLFLPVSAVRPNHAVEVWADVRPAHYMALDSGQLQRAQIQYQRGGHGAWRTLKTLAVFSPGGYLDTHLSFPAKGNVRIAYTYPMSDAFLPTALLGATIYSRTATVTIAKRR